MELLYLDSYFIVFKIIKIYENTRNLNFFKFFGFTDIFCSMNAYKISKILFSYFYFKLMTVTFLFLILINKCKKYNIKKSSIIHIFTYMIKNVNITVYIFSNLKYFYCFVKYFRFLLAMNLQSRKYKITIYYFLKQFEFFYQLLFFSLLTFIFK